jgi:hypothetical protein
VESGGTCFGKHAMGLGKFFDSFTGDLVSDIGNLNRIPDLPFAVEEPLVSCWFPLLNFFNNLIQLRFFQALSL